jgi:galactose mutarotase-like enzyme
VQACVYPGAILTIRLPDHGELWSVPWDFDHRKDVHSLSAFSRQLQYRFVKTLRLEKSDLVIDYTVENHGAEPLKYLWSIHPLLRAETGDRIILPNDVKEVVVNWSHRERLGPAGTVCEWPLARLPDGASEDLGIVKSIEAGSADKLFSRRLQTGYCALYSPSSDESIGFRFDPEQIPFLGMWLCYGGWPATQPGRHHTIALEPCSGDTDSLEEASTRGQCEPLPPRQSRCWSLRLELREGLPQV